MERYSRQILYNRIGLEGQRLIASRTILIVGTGALGSLSSELLARAGVGKLILIDRDYVEHSNLQRQTLYTEKDADEKKPKVIAAKERLLEIRRTLKSTPISHIVTGRFSRVSPGRRICFSTAPTISIHVS